MARGETTASWKYLAQSSSSEVWGLKPHRLGPETGIPKAAKFNKFVMELVKSS
jgi:hypothetical protein